MIRHSLMPHWLLVLMALISCRPATAQQPAVKLPAGEPQLIPLNPQRTVLLDQPGRRLILKGEVCLREGVLEMLACLKKTKEHEAIFAIDTKAQIVHAGLLAMGLEPGKPVQFEPKYQPATGPILDIFVSWNDAEGRPHRVRGQELVRNAVRRYWVEKLAVRPIDLEIDPDGDLRFDEKRKELLWYGPMSDAQRDATLKRSRDPNFQAAVRRIHASTKLKLLEADWVFAGSSFYVDEETGEKFYQAEAGDLICVANFSSATIDVSIASSAGNDDLLYEAYTERIPPLGTKVTLELIPRKKPAPEEKSRIVD